jgi:hypothetical protein
VMCQKNVADNSKSAADEENMLISIVESADYNNHLTESADKHKIP